jgi:hypothetical protein
MFARHPDFFDRKTRGSEPVLIYDIEFEPREPKRTLFTFEVRLIRGSFTRRRRLLITHGSRTLLS